MKQKAIIFITAFLIIITAALAVPEHINLQGKLTDTDGGPLQGAYNFSFRIYNVSEYALYNASVEVPLNATHNTTVNQTRINYTNILWEQNSTITTDNRGIYDITIKNINLSFDKQYYLGITIGDDNETTPRINLSSTPYSFRANVSDDLNPDNIYEVRVMNITSEIYLGDNGTDTLEIKTQYFNFSEGNLQIAENLTLGKKITFAFGEVIDNIVDGFIRITGNLNVTGNTYLNNTLNVVNGMVGIGTTSPTQKLDVKGNASIAGNLTITDGTSSFTWKIEGTSLVLRKV